jgi:predicted amidohydrolase
LSCIFRAAAAQMGPTQKADTREHTLARMIKLLEQAAAKGARLVVFPELAFTTFFPRWLLESEELDSYFERSMPNPQVVPLFERARALGVGFYVGYAELTPEGHRFNCSVLVDGAGRIISKYRKVHLPGSVEPRAGARYQQLEKRYFGYGDLGFPAVRAGSDFGHAIMGMMICNDRRWPESWRVLGRRASSWSASATIRRPMIRMAAIPKMPRCAPSIRPCWRRPMLT